LTPLQSVVHDAKQNAPVEVLTQVLPDGQVRWSKGLHAAVQTPGAGNSDPVTHVSVAPHSAGVVHWCPSVALVLLSRSGGQFAATTQAPNPGQHVNPVRQSAWVVHAVEQNRPLPLARMSVQTAPLGQASPAQPYVHSPPGAEARQLDPTEQLTSLVHVSPMVRGARGLHTPVSQTRPVRHCTSLTHVEESLLQAATAPHIAMATSAARVRILTLPPRPVSAPVAYDTAQGVKLTFARPGCPW
jgi:hypothetical protein